MCTNCIEGYCSHIEHNIVYTIDFSSFSSAVVGNIVVFITLTYQNPTLAPFLSSQVGWCHVLWLMWEWGKRVLPSLTSCVYSSQGIYNPGLDIEYPAQCNTSPPLLAVWNGPVSYWPHVHNSSRDLPFSCTDYWPIIWQVCKYLNIQEMDCCHKFMLVYREQGCLSLVALWSVAYPSFLWVQLLSFLNRKYISLHPTQP